MEYAVTTSQLEKRYGKTACVRDLDLKVPKGAVYGFLGPNGAGKSTTLKMILGLAKPTTGSVSVFGRTMNDQNRLSILKQVGSLIESPAYYGHLTGEENVQIIQALRSFQRHGNNLMWEYAFYQFPMINSLMMPVFLSVLSSRLCDPEHRGNTLKMLKTAAPAGRLYDAKFLCAFVYLVLTAAGQAVLIRFLGQILHFGGGAPFYHYAVLFCATAAVSLCVLAIQQGLSLLLENQMIALVAGLAGGFLGLSALFFPPAVQRLFPWSYYAGLATIQADWSSESNVLLLSFTTADTVPFAVILCMAAVLYVAGRMLYTRKEV